MNPQASTQELTRFLKESLALLLLDASDDIAVACHVKIFYVPFASFDLVSLEKNRVPENWLREINLFRFKGVKGARKRPFYSPSHVAQQSFRASQAA